MTNDLVWRRSIIYVRLRVLLEFFLIYMWKDIMGAAEQARREYQAHHGNGTVQPCSRQAMHLSIFYLSQALHLCLSL